MDHVMREKKKYFQGLESESKQHTREQLNTVMITSERQGAFAAQTCIDSQFQYSHTSQRGEAARSGLPMTARPSLFT